MSKNTDLAKKPSAPDKKESAERLRADLRKIYVNAKRVYREEEAMLALCRNCMDSIRHRKDVVDRLRQETEAEMIACAGRLDERIRKVTRVLDTIARMHVTDSNEAAERLGKLSDIDVAADEQIEDLRKRLALLEYQRREREPLVQRAIAFIRALLYWIALKMNQLMLIFRAIVKSASRKELPPPPSTAERAPSETSVSPVLPGSPLMPRSPAKTDEVDVSLKHKIRNETPGQHHTPMTPRRNKTKRSKRRNVAETPFTTQDYCNSTNYGTNA